MMMMMTMILTSFISATATANTTTTTTTTVDVNNRAIISATILPVSNKKQQEIYIGKQKRTTRIVAAAAWI